MSFRPTIVSLIYLTASGQTPNRILSTTDIPERNERTEMAEDVEYPVTGRYTLQWLTAPNKFMSDVIPNNRDATFKKRSRKAKPSDLLLHYNYGAAAVKQWGYGVEAFQQLPKARPPGPVTAPLGPERTTHTREKTIQQLDTARNASRGGSRNRIARAASGSGTRRTVNTEQAEWDEDDVMLFSGETRRLRKIGMKRNKWNLPSIWNTGG